MTNAISTDITPTEAARLLASGEAVLVDVREPDEFRAEHIAVAVSLPLSTLREQLGSLPLPAGRKIIFQCQKGGRSAQACAIAGATGPQRQAYNLAGGISGWKAAGLPVVSPAGAPRAPSIFRQVQIVVGLAVALGVLAGFSGHQAGFMLAGLLGAALAFAGLTGWCGLAMLLARMPWNRAG